ncbi:MAG TPA: ribonuclease PH, partial [Kamptonema sp.]|nr:ribonuclease PH [Kamptonema sp.]
EIQGTAEKGSFSRPQLNQMLDVAEIGIQELLEFQRQALGITSI